MVTCLSLPESKPESNMERPRLRDRASCVRFAAVMVAVVLAVGGPRPCQSEVEVDWGQLARALGSYIKDLLWKNNSNVEFMGHTCDYSQRPGFYRWQLYFRGEFKCPTWTSITGTFHTRSRSSVQSQTIEDFLNKVRAAGLVTDEQAKGWLQSRGQSVPSAQPPLTGGSLGRPMKFAPLSHALE